MKITPIFLAAALAVATLHSAHAQALPSEEIASDGPAYMPGEILVQFKSEATAAQIGEAFRQGGLKTLKHVQTLAMKDHGKVGLTRASTAMPVPAAAQLLGKLPGVEFAEPNWLYTHQAVSDDPLYAGGQLWGMYGDDLGTAIGPAPTKNPFGSQAEKAWAAGFTGLSAPDLGAVYVGIIDEGIQFTHPDLSANVWINPFDRVDGIDNDGNGYIDDVHGWDCFENNNSIFDGPGDDHGTHVTGTIAAKGGNGLGVAGVNWNVTYISGKFLGPSGGNTADAIEAIDYFTGLKTRHGLNIVALNNSWGGGGFSQALLDAIVRAANEDILFIAAAGNAASNNDITAFYPARYDTTAGAGYNSVIAVAALQSNGALASFSNYGNYTVHLAAPGAGVLSTVPYVTPTVTVGSNSYVAGQLTYSAAGTKAAALVDGEQALTSDSSWAGKVVLVERGVNLFIDKVRNVQNAGGVAAVIYNNVPGGFSGTLGAGNSSTIPAVSISQEDGVLLKASALGVSATVEVPPPGTLGNGYAYYDGTSMATPHVTGAAALYASTHQGATAPEIRDALLSSVAAPTDSSVLGKTITGGRLDLSTVIAPSPPPSPPVAPTGLRAIAGNNQVSLAWVGSPGATSYKVKRRTSNGTYSTLSPESPVTNTSFVDSTVVTGTTYYYVVSAVNVNGAESANSTEVSPLAPPAAPTGLSATAISRTQINLTWTDTSNNEDVFRIERSATNNKFFGEIATVGAGQMSFSDSGVVRNTTYYYRVRATNAAGNGGYSNTASTKTPK